MMRKHTLEGCLCDVLVIVIPFCLWVLNLAKLAICLALAKNCTREY